MKSLFLLSPLTSQQQFLHLLRRRTSNQSCRSKFDDFSCEELSNQIEGLAQRFNLSEDGDENVEEPAFVASKTLKTSNISPIVTPMNPRSITLVARKVECLSKTLPKAAVWNLTHTAVTPLDLVKCNMQIDPAKYKSITSGFGVLLKEQGVKGFFKGWVPTLLGYSAQGVCKFGFYEFFKKYYSDLAGPEFAAKYKTLIYLAGSASAEFSGFLLYKELGRRLKKTNPVVAEIFSLMSRDEARHAVLNKGLLELLVRRWRCWLYTASRNLLIKVYGLLGSRCFQVLSCPNSKPFGFER